MSKIPCKGDKCQVSISSVYTDIPQTDSIDGPDPTINVNNTTALDSAVGEEMKVTGHAKGGQVKIGMFFDPANTVHKYLLSKVAAPSSDLFKRIFSDGATTTWPFTAVVERPPAPKSTVNGHYKADLTLTLDGTVTYP